MRRSDFSAGINRSSLPSSGLTICGPVEISWGKIEQCPAASALTTPRPPTDIGRCVGRHANPGPRSPFEGSLTFGAAVRLRLPPHTPSRDRLRLSNVQTPSRAVAFTSWLPPLGSTGDFHPQSLDHAQRTFRSSRPGGSLPQASHRTGLAGHASGSSSCCLRFQTVVAA